MMISDDVFQSSVSVRRPDRRKVAKRVLFSFTGIFLILSVIHMLFFRVSVFTCPRAGMQPEVATSKRKRRMGDGCYNIYLDVGANIGVHTRFLFEPDLYPNAESARSIFDNEFGKVRDNRDFCSFGFEPNPIHVAHHREQEKAYKAIGWRYQFIHAGVSDHDGNLTFYRDESEVESENNEWGFSMVKRIDQAIPVQVPVIDFVDWIKENIGKRELPKIVHGNYTKPKVVMKLDIEASEYVVMPRLLFSGIMCEILDLTFGELHPSDAYRVQRKATNHENARGEIKFEANEDVQQWQKWLLSKGFDSQTLEGCPGRWMYLDDEAYVADSTPLP